MKFQNYSQTKQIDKPFQLFHIWQVNKESDNYMQPNDLLDTPIVKIEF